MEAPHGQRVRLHVLGDAPVRLGALQRVGQHGAEVHKQRERYPIPEAGPTWRSGLAVPRAKQGVRVVATPRVGDRSPAACSSAVAWQGWNGSCAGTVRAEDGAATDSHTQRRGRCWAHVQRLSGAPNRNPALQLVSFNEINA